MTADKLLLQMNELVAARRALPQQSPRYSPECSAALDQIAKDYAVLEAAQCAELASLLTAIYMSDGSNRTELLCAANSHLCRTAMFGICQRLVDTLRLHFPLAAVQMVWEAESRENCRQLIAANRLSVFISTPPTFKLTRADSDQLIQLITHDSMLALLGAAELDERVCRQALVPEYRLALFIGNRILEGSRNYNDLLRDLRVERDALMSPANK